MIFANVLAKLQQYNINTTGIDEFNIRTLIEDTKLEIVTYCNLNEYPTDNKNLDIILVNLVVFNFLKNKNIALNEETSGSNAGAVKSINVGDFSVSYGISDITITNDFIDNQIKKYYLMLNKFRRVKW